MEHLSGAPLKSRLLALYLTSLISLLGPKRCSLLLFFFNNERKKFYNFDGSSASPSSPTQTSLPSSSKSVQIGAMTSNIKTLSLKAILRQDQSRLLALYLTSWTSLLISPLFLRRKKSFITLTATRNHL